jgi:beta-glucanase (GH16 family)
VSVLAAVALLMQAQGLSATNVAVDAPMAAPTSAPSWADEFNGTAIDRRAWRFDTSRNKDGWYNHEKQYYADARRPENARVEDGHLVIEARREALSPTRFPDWGGQAYTSAKLIGTTKHRYGFYEIRAKLPCARGTWPAIWMLPDGGTWPQQGEIDIMEMVGHQPGIVHATLHTGLFNHVRGTQRGSQKEVATACTQFHRYQLHWRADAITIGVDDRAYMKVRNDQPGGRGAWPFDTPFRLILNLAVGGDWGGAQGIDDAALPQRMEIDYVRVWKQP